LSNLGAGLLIAFGLGVGKRSPTLEEGFMQEFRRRYQWVTFLFVLGFATNRHFHLLPDVFTYIMYWAFGCSAVFFAGLLFVDWWKHRLDPYSPESEKK
jgi:amino acid permease